MLQLLCNTSKANSLDLNVSLTTGSFIYACQKVLILGRQQYIEATIIIGASLSEPHSSR